MQSQVPTTARNDWIQVLRALAALAVLCFHMQPHWNTSALLGPWLAWATHGFAGVDIFFVLSGFVVYLSARRTVTSVPELLRFLRKRGLRIYLGYWPVFLLSILIAALAVGKMPVINSTFLRSAFLLQPDIWLNIVPTAWSLTFELWFYLCLGVIVWWAGPQPVRAIVCAMLVLVIWNDGWLFLDQRGVYRGLQPFRYVLTALMLEFLAGALIAHAYLRNASLFTRTLPWAALGIALMCLGWSFGASSIWYGRAEMMRVASYGVAGVGALVVTLAISQTALKAPRLLVCIGDASYSLYLLHPLLLGFGGDLRFRYTEHSFFWKNVLLLAMPVAIVAISMLWFHWIERPTIAWAGHSSRHGGKRGFLPQTGAEHDHESSPALRR